MGEKLVVWDAVSINNGAGASYSYSYVIVGAVYDSDANTWVNIPKNGQWVGNDYPATSINISTITTGSELIFWGGNYMTPDSVSEGAIFDPNAPSAYAWTNITNAKEGSRYYYIYANVPE